MSHGLRHASRSVQSVWACSGLAATQRDQLSTLYPDRQERPFAAIDVATQRCGAAFALLPFVHHTVLSYQVVVPQTSWEFKAHRNIR